VSKRLLRLIFTCDGRFCNFLRDKKLNKEQPKSKNTSWGTENLKEK